MGLAGWMDSNLATQGYCLGPAEARRLRLGLRLSTGLCLAPVVVALALQSAVMVTALVPIGALAGWTRRHPFDHLCRWCSHGGTAARPEGRC